MRMSKKNDIIMLIYEGFIQKCFFLIIILNVTFTGCRDVVSPCVLRKVDRSVTAGTSKFWAFILKCVGSFHILAGALALPHSRRRRREK